MPASAEQRRRDVRERPILFSGEMVRALLDGRKTQTRRVMQGVPSTAEGPFEAAMAPESGPFSNQWAMRWDGKYHRQRCPYGRVGDHLWVRETIRFNDEHANAYYVADNRGVGEETYRRLRGVRRGRLTISSRFCYRWASRITLKLTAVRVERVQDIREEDATAEGVEAVSLADVPRQATWSNRQDFAQLWDSLNAKRGYGWEQNPWVWVLAFTVLTLGGSEGVKDARSGDDLQRRSRRDAGHSGRLCPGRSPAHSNRNNAGARR